MTNGHLNLAGREKIQLRTFSTTVPLKRPTDATPNGERSRNVQHPALKASAAPPEMPSTIPDSTTAKPGSQSENDTQPLSQGAREQFAREMRELHDGYQFEATTANASTWSLAPRSCQPGESGHIDFVTGFDQQSQTDIEGAGEEQDDDIEPDSQAADVRVELFPESRRFQQPITPATTSRKRQRVSSPTSHRKTTPRLPVNPFAGQPGGLDGMMNASQAFKATQYTSPVTNGLPSDALSERPSPDLFHAQRPSTADPVSSPVHLRNSRMTRAVTEPQTTYISIEESQVERERQRKELEMAQQAARQETSDDDFDSEDSDLRRRRIRRKIESESKEILAGVTAKARSGPNRRGRGGRRKSTPRSVSSRRFIESGKDAVIISDSPVTDGNISEDETEKEDVHINLSSDDSPDQLSEENKENYTVKDFQIPTTPSSVKLRRATATTVGRTPPILTTESVRGLPNVPNKYVSTDSTDATEVVEDAPPGTATVAVADSQPSHSTHGNPASDQLDKSTRTEDRSEEQRSFIPQSQLSPTPTSNPTCTDSSSKASEPPVCVPVSSNSPTLHRGNDHQQSRSDGDNSSYGGPSFHGSARVSGSTNTPVQTQEIRSSPPLIESERVRRGVDINELSRKSVNLGGLQPIQSEMHNTHSNSVTIMADAVSSKPSEMVQNPSDQPRKDISQSTILEKSASEVTQGNHPAPSVPHLAVSSASGPGAGVTANSTIEAQSRPSTFFDTAPTHMTGSPALSNINTTPQRPRGGGVGSSPRSARPKSMLEIASEPSPPDPMSGIDIDVNLVTAEDEEYHAVINGSSPIRPRKRRRGRFGRVLEAGEPISDTLPTQVPSRPIDPNTTKDITTAINPAKDQLAEPRATPKPAVETESPSPSQRNARPNPSTVSASRKRGRPKKSDISAAKRNSIVLDKTLEGPNAKAPKLKLPHIQTSARNNDMNDDNLTNTSVVAPNRVFAHFNGNCAAYYPATCIGVVRGRESQYRVRFDDGTVDVINGFGIKRLELKPGDSVKLDLGGNRKKTYVVITMQDRHQPMLTPDPDTPTRGGFPAQACTTMPGQTDINGYANVVVSLKQPNNANDLSIEHFVVPVKDVYFTQSMWTNLKDRIFTYVSLRSLHSNRLETPLEQSSISSTPSSRTHRVKTSAAAPSRSSKPYTNVHSTLFDNMVFAITNIADPTLREALKNLISNHGGYLLPEDFSELFHIPSLDPVTPSKRSPKRDTDPKFHLTPAASRMGFTCLIADKHCRMAKYIQALALGIPCLSSRWIQDCVEKQTILAWEPYLLAAGESVFLNGAVRSRILPSHNAQSVTLADIIEARPKPLAGASVVLIMEKSEEVTMRSHPLLSHALGARRVSRATSAEVASKMLIDAETNGECWNWVYSHGKEEKVEKILFGRGKASKSWLAKKRKRGDGPVSVESTKPRVVGNEFVIQSLILGKLICID